MVALELNRAFIHGSGANRPNSRRNDAMRLDLIALLVSAAAVETLSGQRGIGAKYGARDPMTCDSRKQPVHGAPSAEQAKMYFLCDAEHENVRAVEMANSLVLYSEVQLEVAPTPRPFNPRTDWMRDIDPKRPVYNVRGSFAKYQCSRPGSNGPASYPAGKN
jgi:hypothetical protein